jgi:methyl-accepting chemotaxis protein
MWTFGRRISLGFAIPSILLLLIGLAAYRAIGLLVRTSYAVTHTHQVLEDLERALSILKDAETGQRGFVITGDESFLEPYQAALPAIPGVIKELRELTQDNPRQQTRLDQADALVQAKLAELKRTIDLRRSSGFEPTMKAVSEGTGKRAMDDLRRIVGAMEEEERALLRARAGEVEGASASANASIVYGTLVSLVFVLAAGLLIVRSLSGQIGSAVLHVQSSSAELQAAANQQVTGAKEQTTAMNEISTTIRELLATSRQISESAQRVAEVALQTASAAKAGGDTVQRSEDSIGTIRRQVDAIVAHMAELGRKSQQIGGVLEIINELAEQTNILAINATIEASGAGEAGRRFSVVADEIRKLADRVGGSTKEIRGLVDDVRAAVNTTVMATEGGSKAVDAGSRQFAEVQTSFRSISGLVGTTTEAAKEIELSTKQQTSAVEQVNAAIANVAQAAKETEASSSQTLQTSSQLTTLAKDLARVIRPQGIA